MISFLPSYSRQSHLIFNMLSISADESFKLISDHAAKEQEIKNEIIGKLRTFFFENLNTWLSGEKLKEDIRPYSDGVVFALGTSGNNKNWK